MAKGWYVLHVYSGHESKVEKYIKLYMDEGVFGGVVCDVKVPSEEVVEVRAGKKRSVNKKILPGYILLEMDLPERGWKKTCVAIRKIQGVLGFVGTSNDSLAKPQPISADEAKAVLQRAGDIKADKGLRVGQDFAIGEQVRVIEGPFEMFTGVVEEVNHEKGRLRVMVGIFGRSTPVEVEFHQVEKV